MHGRQVGVLCLVYSLSHYVLGHGIGNHGGLFQKDMARPVNREVRVSGCYGQFPKANSKKP